MITAADGLCILDKTIFALQASWLVSIVVWSDTSTRMYFENWLSMASLSQSRLFIDKGDRHDHHESVLRKAQAKLSTPLGMLKPYKNDSIRFQKNRLQKKKEVSKSLVEKMPTSPSLCLLLVSPLLAEQNVHIFWWDLRNVALLWLLQCKYPACVLCASFYCYRVFL